MLSLFLSTRHLHYSSSTSLLIFGKFFFFLVLMNYADDGVFSERRENTRIHVLPDGLLCDDDCRCAGVFRIRNLNFRTIDLFRIRNYIFNELIFQRERE